ncbi:hypothetical protein ASZ90_007365 [hydrocarbon metagenome]|uniref:Uncharacterized protein n=1 Tax=hydrocarbon metagenome TaxID=938273 RepID=A0A0W8FPN4_9ZZZZ
MRPLPAESINIYLCFLEACHSLANDNKTRESRVKQKWIVQ